MPLPPSPVPRQRLHPRGIAFERFRRDDGLFDIDAHLVDAKDQRDRCHALETTTDTVRRCYPRWYRGAV